jgi:hypothetical protein
MRSIQKPSYNAVDLFLAACVFVLLLPLLPLGFELLFTHDIKVDSLFLTAAMYIVGLGLASRLISYFAASLVAGLFAAGLYGYAASQSAGDKHVRWAWGIIIVAGLTHCAERYYRHVVLREEFFEWLR